MTTQLGYCWLCGRRITGGNGVLYQLPRPAPVIVLCYDGCQEAGALLTRAAVAPQLTARVTAETTFSRPRTGAGIRPAAVSTLRS